MQKEQSQDDQITTVCEKTRAWLMEQNKTRVVEKTKEVAQPKKIYKDVDKSILKAIRNPANKPYEIKTKQPELTFLGVHNQPDFAVLYILMYPGKKVIELKSLKFYLHQFRDIIISYERILNVIFDHLNEVYEPERLRLVLDCNPRGGISSRLCIDSDWSILGGKDKYKDWSEQVW